MAARKTTKPGAAKKAAASKRGATATKAATGRKPAVKKAGANEAPRGGAMSLYSEDVLLMAADYIENFSTYGDVFPSKVGFARVLGITRQTIDNWKNDPEKEEFRELMDRLLGEQERVLWNKGLTGVFNAALAKLGLSKHGYSEKSEVEHTGKDGGPIQQITATMSQEEASRIYIERLRGEG